MENKKPGQEFENFLQEAKQDPQVAEYLDRRITKEQALGYLIATIKSELSYLEAIDQAAIVMEMEKQFLTMQPKEAEQVFANSLIKT